MQGQHNTFILTKTGNSADTSYQFDLSVAGYAVAQVCYASKCDSLAEAPTLAGIVATPNAVAPSGNVDAAGARVIAYYGSGAGAATTFSGTYPTEHDAVANPTTRRGIVTSQVASASGATGTIAGTFSGSATGNAATVVLSEGIGVASYAASQPWSGAVTDSGFTVSSKHSDTTKATRLKVSTAADYSNPTYFPSSGGVTPDAQGFVKIAATGLPANTKHYYTWETDPSGRRWRATSPPRSRKRPRAAR